VEVPVGVPVPDMVALVRAAMSGVVTVGMAIGAAGAVVAQAKAETSVGARKIGKIVTFAGLWKKGVSRRQIA